MKSKRITVVLAAALMTSTAGAQPSAQETVQKVREGCQKELDTYCKNVTPGEGRVFACLYAYSDKLSGRCEYALYDASQQLESAIAKLDHVSKSCADDLNKYCSDIKPGEGRVASCMRKNQGKVSPVCQQAMKDTGMIGK